MGTVTVIPFRPRDGQGDGQGDGQRDGQRDDQTKRKPSLLALLKMCAPCPLCWQTDQLKIAELYMGYDEATDSLNVITDERLMGYRVECCRCVPREDSDEPFEAIGPSRIKAEDAVAAWNALSSVGHLIHRLLVWSSAQTNEGTGIDAATNDAIKALPACLRRTEILDALCSTVKLPYAPD